MDEWTDASSLLYVCALVLLLLCYSLRARTYKVQPSVLRWDGGSCAALQCCSQSIESRPFQSSLARLHINSRNNSESAGPRWHTNTALPSHTNTHERALIIYLCAMMAPAYTVPSRHHIYTRRSIVYRCDRGGDEGGMVNLIPPTHPPLLLVLAVWLFRKVCSALHHQTLG